MCNVVMYNYLFNNILVTWLRLLRNTVTLRTIVLFSQPGVSFVDNSQIHRHFYLIYVMSID